MIRRRRASRRERQLRRHAIETSRRGLKAIVDALLEAIQPAVIGHNHCIVSSRLLIDVLSSVGVEAVPMSCILHARNAACCRDPDAPDALEHIIGDLRDGRVYPGHLIVATKLDKWHLVDAAISQVAQVERGIPDAGALIEPITSPDLISNGGQAVFEAPCGAQFEYAVLPPRPPFDEWYRDTDDWNWESEPKQAYIDMILRLAMQAHKSRRVTP
jgi:hypothetical protein